MDRRGFLKLSGGALVTAWAAPNLLLADAEFPNLLRNGEFTNWSHAGPADTVYWVRYSVPGVRGGQGAGMAGPYWPDEAMVHRDDIAGYEGITEVEIVKDVNNEPRRSLHQSWFALDIPYMRGRPEAYWMEEQQPTTVPSFDILRLNVPVRPHAPSGAWHNGSGVITEEWFMRWIKHLTREGRIEEAVGRAQQMLDSSVLIARHASGS